jgi:DNA replication and repair protein RecF
LLPTDTGSAKSGSGLQSLEIIDFRNFRHAALTFSPGLNLVTGKNAAGKTSFLEAIYCLGRVRSFRTHLLDRSIRFGQPAFRLIGQVSPHAGRQIPIGIEKQTAELTVHLDGKSIRRLSDLAGYFPVQVMSSDMPTILNGGPKIRRQSLDWALFHVEQTYRDVWQRYARILRQRNAALRMQVPYDEVRVWDRELIDAAGEMDESRRSYFSALAPGFRAELENLLPEAEITFTYQPGWPANTTLADGLERSLQKDHATGYTRYGPHRADFKLLIDGRSVSDHCSRGQQKAITVAFMLAQVKLQYDREVPVGAFLLDDLSSELDEDFRLRVLTALRELNTQVFVTAIEGLSIDVAAWPSSRRFHVEHGCIQEVV